MSKLISNFANTTTNQLGQQAKTLTLLLGLTALLLAMGFLFGDSAGSSNYKILLELFDPKVWSMIFFAYGSLKIYHLLDRLPHLLRVATSVCGTWIWLYVFLSFVIFDPKGISPAELLVVLPLACEAGELVLDIFNLRLCRPSKRNPSV